MKIPRHIPMIPAIVVAGFTLAACGDSAEQPSSTTVHEMMDDTSTTVHEMMDDTGTTVHEMMDDTGTTVHEMMDDTTPTTGG